MRITIAGHVVFDHADTLGASLDDTAGTIARTLQQIRPMRGASARSKDRGLKSTELRFTVIRPNTAEDAMIQALFALEAAIDVDGDLVLTSTNGAIVVTIPGNLQSLGFRHMGTRSFHDYAFTGGAPVITGTPSGGSGESSGGAPPSGGGDFITTEGGGVLTTEDGTGLATES
jgi:hypothetical protein